METIPPNKLLVLWSHEAISAEDAIRQILQNLIALQRALDALNVTIANLRADVDSLIAHTKMPLDPKRAKRGSQKP